MIWKYKARKVFGSFLLLDGNRDSARFANNLYVVKVAIGEPRLSRMVCAHIGSTRISRMYWFELFRLFSCEELAYDGCPVMLVRYWETELSKPRLYVFITFSGRTSVPE